MKTLTGISILIFSALMAYGQSAQTAIPATPPMPLTPKVIAEISAGSGRVVKGSPFSADAVSESVQMLADGNRITRKWNERLYRSSDGKFRREGSGIPGSAFGSVLMTGTGSGTGIYILDPVGGASYTLNTDSRTFRTTTLRRPTPIILNGDGQKTIEPIILNGQGQGGTIATTIDMDKIKTELNAAQVELRAVEAVKATAIEKAMTIAAAPLAAIAGAPGQKWDTRTEQLGVQNIEGVDAEGTRTITTIPADAIGNERPIEIVYERWYSKELQMIVYSKHTDPRFGEQTYRLTNINRSEPDPSLFEVPAGYKVLSEGPRVYKLAAPNAAKTSVEKVSAVKAATSNGTKP